MICGKKKKSISYAKWGYIFAIPFIVGFLMFTVYPLLETFVDSFTDLQGFETTEVHFVGLQNYAETIQNKYFWQSLKNTIIEWGISGLIQVPLGLLVVAWFINKELKIRGQGLMKAIAYIPNIINTAAISLFFTSFFSYPGGILNQILKQAGILEKSFDFLANYKFARGLITYTDLWRYWGAGMLLFLAAAKSINPELYEAASIDGAGNVKKFFHITIPGIRNVLVFQMVGIFAGGLQLYDAAQMIGGGSKKTRTVAIYIRGLAFGSKYRISEGSAASFILFAIILIINLIVLRVFKERNPVERRRRI